MVVQAGRKTQAYPLNAKEPAAALGTIPRLPPVACPPQVTLEAAAATRTMTGRSLLPSTAGRILRCLLLLVVRADREVHAYPRCAIAHVGAPRLRLQLTLHFRFHCLDRAHLIGAPSLILREVPQCQSVSPFGFCPHSPSGSPLRSVAAGLLPNPVPPLGFRPLPLKGLPLDPKIECPLGLEISGCTGRATNLSGEGTLTPCVLRDGLCARISFADGGSSRPKGPSISPDCERACSSTGHDSSLASICLPPSGHTGGSSSLADNDRPLPSAFDDGLHTQVSFAAGGSSRPRGPCMSPVSDCTCRIAEHAPSVDPALPLSLPGLCALDRSAESDLQEVPPCQLVSPFGFSPSSPSGSPLCSVAEGLLRDPVPPLGFSPPSPKGLPQDPDFECPLGLVTPGSTGRVKNLSGQGTLTSCVLQAGLCDRVSFADGGSSRLKGPSISPKCERACSSNEHDSSLASSCLSSSDRTGGSSSLADNNMPPPSAFDDGPHTQVFSLLVFRADREVQAYPR